MQRIYNSYCMYPNRGMGTATCFLQVYHAADEPVIAIVTELPDNWGTSITSAITDIADRVRCGYGIAQEDLVVIEHYPAGTQHRRDFPDDEDIFSRVVFKIRGGRFQHPRWIHLPRIVVETLIGQPFEVAI